MARKKNNKRANNEGSFYFNKQRGVWVGQITVGFDENGKQIRKTATGETRSAVVVKLAPYMKDGKRIEEVPDVGKIKEHMMNWLLTYKRHMVGSRTFEKYVRMAQLHILPVIGDYTIHTVSKDLLQKVLNRLFDKDYTSDTIAFVKHEICQYFEFCVDDGLIERNPALKLKIQTRRGRTTDADEPEYKAIPEEIREQFLEVLNKNRFFKPFCLVGICAGLRPGEILGLKWKDFDDKKKVLSVRRAQTVEMKFDANGKVLGRQNVIGKTKTAGSVRTIPLSDLLLNALTEWKTVRTLQEKVFGASLASPEDYIFGTNKGELRSYSGTKTMFERFMKSNGMGDSGITFYRLRHTFSNTLFEANENPKVVQTLMGHARVSTTMIYNTAATTKYLEKAVSIFDDRYGESVKFSESPKAEEVAVDPATAESADIAKFLTENHITSVGDLVRLLQSVGTGV